MKAIPLVFCLAVSAPLFYSCQKDKHDAVPAFDYEDAAGIWVPYELRDESGVTHSSGFFGNSLFGFYTESVLLNSDKTYIPINWSVDTFAFRPLMAGTFEYLPVNQLKFIGPGIDDHVWTIMKFEGDELWLTLPTQLGVAFYKFRRQH